MVHTLGKIQDRLQKKIVTLSGLFENLCKWREMLISKFNPSPSFLNQPISRNYEHGAQQIIIL